MSFFFFYHSATAQATVWLTCGEFFFVDLSVAEQSTIRLTAKRVPLTVRSGHRKRASPEDMWTGFSELLLTFGTCRCSRGAATIVFVLQGSRLDKNNGWYIPHPKNDLKKKKKRKVLFL